MKIVTTLNLIFAFLLLPVLVSGQKDYQTGYIITTRNDTLTGKVKDRKPPPFSKLYKKIRFKRNRLLKRKYGPQQIIAYKQGNNQFESLWIDVSQNIFKEIYTSVPDLGEKSFMKVIVKGYLTYYHWEFQDYESDYIDEISLFKRTNESSLARVTQGIFGLKKKRLAEYFQDCPELINKIEKGELTNPVEIAIFYNNWKENNP
ncbi:MAG: hypothetical protein J7L04_00545 [Bacteroidales bacterium]|nr:hypothetical protein [Bacteroidales bacterium]